MITMLTSLPVAGGEADASSLLCFADLVYQQENRLSTTIFCFFRYIFSCRRGDYALYSTSTEGGVLMQNNQNNNQNNQNERNQNNRDQNQRNNQNQNERYQKEHRK